MRRRGRFIQYGANYVRNEGHSTPGPPTGQTPRPDYIFNETPEAWRKYAREPWRIIFPNLDWKPPEID